MIGLLKILFTFVPSLCASQYPVSPTTLTEQTSNQRARLLQVNKCRGQSQSQGHEISFLTCCQKFTENLTEGNTTATR